MPIYMYTTHSSDKIAIPRGLIKGWVPWRQINWLWGKISLHGLTI